MTTHEALQQLTTLQARQVALVKPGQFAALVRYDSRTNELVIRAARSSQQFNLAEVLLESTPIWVV
ncbi:MAG: hypothetical protein WCG80_13445 [Spirochaetales bacterium]